MQFAPKITDFRARYICVRKYQRSEFDIFMTFPGARVKGCIPAGITATDCGRRPFQIAPLLRVSEGRSPNIRR